MSNGLYFRDLFLWANQHIDTPKAFPFHKPVLGLWAEEELACVGLAGVSGSDGRGQSKLIKSVADEGVEMRVAHYHLNLLFLCNISHLQLDHISRFRIVLRIGSLSPLVDLLLVLLLRNFLLHDHSCNLLACKADLKRGDSGSCMHWKDVIDVQSLLAAVVVNLSEFDIREALDDVDMIVEALQRQL